METLYAIIISSAIIICILICMLYKMEKIKRQNDMIYEAKLRKDRFMKECKRIAEETDIHKIENTHPVRLEDTAIEGIEMSARLRRCLNAAEIKSLERASQYNKKELLCFRNFGYTSLLELRGLMNKHNLKFKE